MDVDGAVRWYAPDPRAILELDGLRISRSLRRSLARAPYRITVDRCFAEVMRGCAQRQETWISAEFIAAYSALHAQGLAHSVEAWSGEELVGGLYGVSLGAAFMGESMFHRATDASKHCLVHLVERLRAGSYRLLDIQMQSPHMASLGAIEISREDYLARLARALRQPGPWNLPRAEPQ